MALSAAGLTLALGRLTPAAVPASLAARAAASLDPATVPAAVTVLSRGVLQMMLVQKLKVVAPLVGIAAVVLAATGLLADEPKSNSGPPPVPKVVLDPGEQPAPGPRAPNSISAPVAYKDLMLVLVTTDGAAAVVFRDVVEGGKGVAYKFRYESADGKTTRAGEGKVLERRLPGGAGYDVTSLDIKAGPMTLRWSAGGPERGWIYYIPEAMAVHLADAGHFEDNVRMIGPQRVEHKALDLKRFLRK